MCVTKAKLPFSSRIIDDIRLATFHRQQLGIAGLCVTVVPVHTELTEYPIKPWSIIEHGHCMYVKSSGIGRQHVMCGLIVILWKHWLMLTGTGDKPTEPGQDHKTLTMQNNRDKDLERE